MRIKDGFKGQQAIVLPQNIIDLLENNPLTAPLHMTDIGYYPKASFHFRERNEGISQYIFIYCIKGKGWFRAAGVTKTIQENQFFILPAGQPHAYGSNEQAPWTIYWIHFKGNLAGAFMEPASTYPKNITPGENSRIEYRLSIFEKIYTTLEMGYSKENLEFACIHLQYFLSSTYYLSQFRGEYTEEEDKSRDVITYAIHFMRENLGKKILVDDIARAAGLSTTYFSTFFQKQTGSSPISYLNNLRIQQGCQYLDFTDLKINQICHKIGYEDPYYFSRIFTKIMGMAPKEYRKREKG